MWPVGKLPSYDVLVTCILRVLTILSKGFVYPTQRICLPYRFCKVHIPAQYKIVWMLYGLGNTSPISRTGLYGARNGPIRSIGPNILAGLSRYRTIFFRRT